MLRFCVMWVLTMLATALAAQTDTAPMSVQDSTALQVKRTTVWALGMTRWQ